ncbi:MAG: transposase [Terriglobia bacterium]
MRYSQGFKESVLKKVLPPESKSVAEVSRDTGIAAWTIYQWKRAVREGKLDEAGGQLRPEDRNPGEKLRLVIEGSALEEARRGEWLREHGLHTEHLRLWEQELRDIVSDKDRKLRQEPAETKKRLKEKERELARKEKALAEVAALLTLKKKADAIWGDDEED